MPIDPSQLSNGSVVDHPTRPNEGGFFGETYSITLAMADAADTVPAWGNTPGLRDQFLRAFWPTEPMFASALYSTVARYAAFGWTLKGPPLTTAAVQRLLHSAEFGEGWIPFISKVLIDLFTQDNGAFIEVVRNGPQPASPPVGLNHLDSAHCVRTGIPETPVIYYDRRGRGHLMKWFQVIPLAEFPSPRQEHNGMQYCALTRCLRAAQIMRDILVYKREKVSGRFEKAIHLVSGMPTRMIEDALQKHRQTADSMGQMRFVMPAIIGTLDPNATVSHAQIDLASLPDNFNEDLAMQWYVTNLALAFGTDYGDFAPAPGRGIGSGTEAKTSHVKSRGKGAAAFMGILGQVFNFRGVMPSSVRFEFGEQDLAQKFDEVAVSKERAVWLDLLIKSGTITTEVARQILVDTGDLDPRYLQMMQETDATGEVELVASLPPPPDTTVAPGEPGPKGPAGPKTQPNDNLEKAPPTESTKRPAVTV